MLWDGKVKCLYRLHTYWTFDILLLMNKKSSEKINEKLGGSIEVPINEDSERVREELLEEMGDEVKEMSGSGERIDEIFVELLDAIKDSPEAKKEALEVLAKQIQQIAEQIKQTRDIEHLQEVKVTMLENWNKLVELTKDDSKLLEKIQAWGNKFVESKILYYEKIDGVKDELIGQSESIRLSWNDMQVEMGKIKGLVGDTSLSREIEKLLNPRSLDMEEVEKDPLRAFANKSPIEEFVNSINSITTGYSEKDIDLVKSAEFVGVLTKVIRMLSEGAYKKGLDGQPIDVHPELGELLNQLQEKSAQLQKDMNEASRIIKMTKIIRDTHFLPEYDVI